MLLARPICVEDGWANDVQEQRLEGLENVGVDEVEEDDKAISSGRFGDDEDADGMSYCLTIESQVTVKKLEGPVEAGASEVEIKMKTIEEAVDDDILHLVRLDMIVDILLSEVPTRPET
ncbi:hypothetical protein Adt_42538 [Abeliophyllum distichum]|uniref:Uncharacterized protein n=1 Tax=Abeliophyllum distichum TaxID=126358 RepID=A0ABD1PSW8_9LAMI